MPLTADEYDELRMTGGMIYADDCATRPTLPDLVVSDRARLVIGPEVDLADALRHRVSVPVRDTGLPVEGAPAG